MTSRRNHARAATGSAVLVSICCAAAIGAPRLPVPRTHVADYANVIDAQTQNRIDGYLTELEQKTGAQVVILTVDSTGGEESFDYSLAIAEQWKLGQKGKDNGVLVFVAVRDRMRRIQVGYGLEGALPDAWLDQMMRQLFVPKFQRGEFASGLLDGAVAIANRIADDAGVQLSGVPATRVQYRRRPGGTIGWNCAVLIFLVAMVTIMGGRSRRRRRYFRSWGGGGLLEGMILGNLFGNLGRGGGWSNWSGGGFGGGFGGGSFGGGGGGSFGGGGAGGGW